MEIALRPDITSAAVSSCQEDGTLKDSWLTYQQVRANAKNPFTRGPYLLAPVCSYVRWWHQLQSGQKYGHPSPVLTLCQSL